MSKENERLRLKSISEILDKDFYIPSYQRGYRWDTRQVKDLLDDILEFANDDTVNGFYCLQPIVVKKETIDTKNICRVIDGQQRLTTVFIILQYLKILLLDEHAIETIYTISYETRMKSKDFLEKLNIDEDEHYKENIDFYNMYNAFKIITEWFSDTIKNKKTTKRKFLEVLMGSDKKDIKFIWYEIAEENEIAVFTRLNIGKIPLTNSELIKALLLINITNESEKILLASQWDEIEYKLQNKNFFAFIYAANFNKATKIEYIFDLIADLMSMEIENLRKDDDKKSYYIFDKLIQDENTFIKAFGLSDEKNKYQTYYARVGYLWDDVKRYFRIFEELYNDNTYYHLVGFLVSNQIDIKEIINVFTKKDKDEFLQYLKSEISNVLDFKKDKIFETLDYNNDYKLITKILFLFNVISTMNGEYSRYPFALHKNQNWSLEHIHAQNSENINRVEDMKILLEDQKKYLRGELKTAIEDLLRKDKIEDNEFEEIQNKIFREYSDEIGIHTIDNLALLRREDNSSLNNSIFPSKRDKIKKLDMKGSFIPIGTKNVFLKYYSNNVIEAIKWNKIDRKAHLKAITNVLEDYIGEQKND